jgi:hypothetical protein
MVSLLYSRTEDTTGTYISGGGERKTKAKGGGEGVCRGSFSILTKYLFRATTVGHPKLATYRVSNPFGNYLFFIVPRVIFGSSKILFCGDSRGDGDRLT